ncbi:MAG: hypothetical protein OEY23_18485 [Acidimicrobiia bacterium]|nr:hypothetical protein [Acidimicrobiia bacterium]
MDLIVVFARLKVRLIRNGLRTPLQAVTLSIALVFALLLALAGFAAFAAGGRADADARRLAAIGGFTLVWTLWTFAPVLTGGVDDLVDPSRLGMLPLSRRERMIGQTVGGLIGPGPIAGIVALAGVPVGYLRLGVGSVLVVAATVTLVALSFGSSRALAAALGRAQRSRVGRDLASGLATLAALLSWVVVHALNAAVQAGLGRTLADAARWSPAGWLGHAVLVGSTAGAGGRALAVAAAEVAGAALLAAVVLRGWIRSQDAVAASPGQTRGSSGRRQQSPLFGRALAALPRTPIGAAVAKEVRGLGRVPVQRAQFVGLAVMAAALPLFSRVSGVGPGVAALAWPLVAAASFNQFGPNAQAFWVELSAAIEPRVAVAARALASLLQIQVLALITTVALAVFAPAFPALHSSPYLAAGGAVVVGIGALISQWLPTPLADDASPFANRSSDTSHGCASAVIALLAMAACAAVSIPLVVAALWSLSRPWSAQLAVAAAALVYGGACWGLGVLVSARRLHGREPEFLALLADRVTS